MNTLSPTADLSFSAACLYKLSSSYLEKISSKDIKVHQKAVELFQQKSKYLKLKNNLNTKEFYFSTDDPHIGLMRVQGKNGSPSKLFDLRLVARDEGILDKQILYYVPFSIDEEEGFPRCGGFLKIAYYSTINSSYKEMTETFSICNVESRSRECHMGSALVHFAVQLSFEQKKEKINLNSIQGSATFFCQLGFMCQDPEKEKQLKEAYKNGEKFSGDLMLLTPDSLPIWKKRISEHPIKKSEVQNSNCTIS